MLVQGLCLPEEDASDGGIGRGLCLLTPFLGGVIIRRSGIAKIEFVSSAEGVQVDRSNGGRAGGRRELQKRGSRRLVSVAVGQNGYHRDRHWRTGCGSAATGKGGRGRGAPDGTLVRRVHERGIHQARNHISTAGCTAPIMAATVRRCIREGKCGTKTGLHQHPSASEGRGTKVRTWSDQDHSGVGTLRRARRWGDRL